MEAGSDRQTPWSLARYSRGAPHSPCAAEILTCNSFIITQKRFAILGWFSKSDKRLSDNNNFHVSNQYYTLLLIISFVVFVIYIA